MFTQFESVDFSFTIINEYIVHLLFCFHWMHRNWVRIASGPNFSSNIGNDQNESFSILSMAIAWIACSRPSKTASVQVANHTNLLEEWLQIHMIDPPKNTFLDVHVYAQNLIKSIFNNLSKHINGYNQIIQVQSLFSVGLENGTLNSCPSFFEFTFICI